MSRRPCRSPHREVGAVTMSLEHGELRIGAQRSREEAGAENGSGMACVRFSAWCSRRVRDPIGRL
jgi:hypothetical protein